MNRNTGGITKNNTELYMRRSASMGVNPLCDKLRIMYGPRIDAAVNRSLVRRRELEEEARRNGWSRVRRPAPTYKVKPGIRCPSPKAALAEGSAAGAGAKAYAGGKRNDRTPAPVAAGDAGSIGNVGRGADNRAGVTAMTAAGASRHDTLRSIGGRIIGNDLARKDEIRVERKDFPTGVVFLVAVCAILFMLVVYCSMQKSVMENEIYELENTVSDLSVQSQELSLQLDMKNDLTEIERIAVEEIGMVKRDSVEVRYVSYGSEDKDVDLRETEDERGGFTSILSVFGGKLGEIVEYLN